MTRFHRNVNIAAVVLPFLAILAAIPMLWNELVGWSDLLLFCVMYFFSTVGYHRLLTHRAFQTYKPIEYLFAAAGSMAVEGPVIGWVSDHRRHHAHADTEGIPTARTATATASRARSRASGTRTNVFWLALPSFGEAWHHNHHAFPRSALHGLRWWEVDPGGWVIKAMKRVGLAWNVVLIPKDRQSQRLAENAP